MADFQVEMNSGFRWHAGNFEEFIYMAGHYTKSPPRTIPYDIRRAILRLHGGDSKAELERVAHWLNLQQIDYEVVW
jgi:hypothetical protein